MADSDRRPEVRVSRPELRSALAGGGAPPAAGWDWQADERAAAELAELRAALAAQRERVAALERDATRALERERDLRGELERLTAELRGRRPLSQLGSAARLLVEQRPGWPTFALRSRAAAVGSSPLAPLRDQPNAERVVAARAAARRAWEAADGERVDRARDADDAWNGVLDAVEGRRVLVLATGQP